MLVLVEESPGNYLRFDVFSTGKSLRLFSATFANGSPTVRVNRKISTGTTIYLRLTRSGNQWTGQYSDDGASWTTAPGE